MPIVHSEYSHRFPSYSLVREQIAYISSESGSNELWLADPYGGNREKLTNLNYNLFAPTWCSNGKNIAFIVRHTASSASSIYLFDTSTREVKQLTDERISQIGLISWSSDDRWIYAEATYQGRVRILKVDTNSGEIVPLFRGSGHVVFDQENQRIWFSDSDSNLFWVDAVAPEHTPIQIELSQPLAGQVSWTFHKDTLYYISGDSEYQSIHGLNINTQSEKVLIRVPARTVARLPLSVNKTGTTLFFTQTDLPQIDVKRLSHPTLL